VISGAMRLRVDGRERLLTEGQAIEVPAGSPHRQLPAGPGAGHLGVTSIYPQGIENAEIIATVHARKASHDSRQHRAAPLGRSI
jgi:mannose-6-phosphate isomerase-like protein (cupin superfamily)